MGAIQSSLGSIISSASSAAKIKKGIEELSKQSKLQAESLEQSKLLAEQYKLQAEQQELEDRANVSEQYILGSKSIEDEGEKLLKPYNKKLKQGKISPDVYQQKYFEAMQHAANMYEFENPSRSVQKAYLTGGIKGYGNYKAKLLEGTIKEGEYYAEHPIEEEWRK